MEKSESIINLTKALLKAQKNIGFAVKGSKNPFFKSDYADLPSVMEACKEHLNEAGIFVTQLLDTTDFGDFVITMFVHGETGEYISSKMKVDSHTDVQKRMSSVTYTKRYMLQAMAFIPSLDDDDGNKASNVKSEPQGRKPTVFTKSEPVKEEKVEAPQENLRRRVSVPVDSVKPESKVESKPEKKVEQPTGKTENNDQW